VDDAAALDAAVDVLDAHSTARDAPIRRFLRAREGPARGFLVGMMMSTRSSVTARKPRSWSNRCLQQGVWGGIRHRLSWCCGIGLTEKEDVSAALISRTFLTVWHVFLPL